MHTFRDRILVMRIIFVLPVLLFLLPPKTFGFKKDNLDYAFYPLCGDKAMWTQDYICHCGNRTLSGVADLTDGDYYCCVPPSTSEYAQCEYTEIDPKNSDVRCQNGEVKKKTEPCHHNCWNNYTQSGKLYKTATLYCQDEEFCQPLDQMCSGVCREEAELCDPDNLRCIGDGYDEGQWDFDDYYTVKSLNTKLGKDHGYCLKINNDQVYDHISRADEEKVKGTHQLTVNYTWLIECVDEYSGEIGIQCSDECRSQEWCAGTRDVCNTTYGIVSLDSPELCRNRHYWNKSNFSCDWNEWFGLVGVGIRCSGDYQHCYWPWYTLHDADPFFHPTCVDFSDQVFAINTTCRQFNQQFIETYKTIWCTTERKNAKYCEGGEGLYQDGNKIYNYKIYENLDDWFLKQENDKITDPHGCERSCSTAGPDCLACTHPDFFHCNSTGFCINKENVCDGHPHPSCGGDDEGIDHCLDIYFKKRIVKRYATLVCPSKMYPGNSIERLYMKYWECFNKYFLEMDTLAVVCDDNIECAEDRDEKLCRTGADKYNPLVYAMTALMGLVYVVLKVWFFHLQHQPFGDEEVNMEMVETGE